MNTAILANIIRKSVLELCHKKKASHIGGAFSVADVLAVLYDGVMNVRPDSPDWPQRDRLFYSKGHACTALYAVLNERGFFKKLDLFNDYTNNGSYFTSHVNHKLPGVELSTGSLGHALGVACGVALAAKRQQNNFHIYTIVSDGELDEGSNWEAILFAPHHKLDNMTLVVDYNKIQSFGRIDDVLALDPLKDKFESFHWNVIEINGHDIQAIKEAFDVRYDNMKPKVIIAHTVKGKGVSFMENELVWHYRSPSDDDYVKALAELEMSNA